MSRFPSTIGWAALAAFLFLARPVAAATIYWDGTGTDWNSVGSWSTSSNNFNPDPAAVPGSADVASFSGNVLYYYAVTVDLNGPQSVSELLFDKGNTANAATTLFEGGNGDQTLAIGTGGIVMNSGNGETGPVTIGSLAPNQAVDVALNGNQTWLNNSFSPLTIVNGVSNSSADSPATLTLSNTGQASGGIFLQGVVSDGEVAGTTALVVSMSSNNNFTSTTTLAGANTFSGGTTLHGGNTLLEAAENPGVSGPLGTGAITFSGGILKFSSVNTYDYSSRFDPSSQPIKIDTNGQNVTFASPLMGSTDGSLTLNDTNGGSGTLTLSAANAYTGGTTITSGTLALGVDNALSTGGAVTVGGGTLALGAFNDTVGTVTISSGGITGTTGVLRGAAVNVTNTSGAVAITAVLGGDGALTKTGAGTLVLSARTPSAAARASTPASCKRTPWKPRERVARSAPARSPSAAARSNTAA